MSNLIGKNNTSSVIAVSNYTVLNTDSTDTEIVDVVNNNNNKFKCYKFNHNNIYYYYVIDGIHNYWTDDLSILGYSEIIFPTVSITDNFGNYNWLTFTNQDNITISSGQVLTPQDSYNYDNTKSYSVLRWNVNSSGTLGGRADVIIINDNGVIKLKNISSNTIKIKSARVAVCSNSSVTTTIVYDGTKDNYNAFVFILNGITYYYVLDGIQSEWTDNLNAIGFSKTVPISLSGDYGNNNLLSANTSGGATTIGVGGVRTPYIAGTTNTPSYKWSRVYATVYGYDAYSGGNKIDPTALGYYYVNPGLGWKNIGNTAFTVSFAQVALCSNPCASVVTVYNSKNRAYNAFTYTENGITYYYVLDGIQSEWTDNLDSIHYSLIKGDWEEIILYMPEGKKYYKLGVTSSTITGNLSGYWQTVYTDQECTTEYQFDSTKRYVCGYYHNETDVWIPSITCWNDFSAMPDNTTSDRSLSVEGIALTNSTYSPNNALICYISNWSGTSSYTNSTQIRIRIYPKEQILFYKQDGTVSEGIKSDKLYQINAVDTQFRTKQEINSLGWYSKWRVYSNVNNTGINIRTTPESGNNIDTIWLKEETVVGNPFFDQNDYQKIKYSIDGVVKEGYILSSNSSISYIEKEVTSDILYTRKYYRGQPYSAIMYSGDTTSLTDPQTGNYCLWENGFTYTAVAINTGEDPSTRFYLGIGWSVSSRLSMTLVKYNDPYINNIVYKKDATI